MYIAMNRFKVLKERVADFENAWLNRDSYLHELPGFISFHLLKGPEREDHVLYASHTMWRSYSDFESWTKSEAFRKAHTRAGNQKPTTQGHPEFEGFQVLQEVTADGQVRRPGSDDAARPGS
jgi:heme-degrading monooxygenase HmoA